ncbi:fatty acid synthase [Plakobranchus ocellatus]|uniref:Fatty acid synthase n=1 Tax=Plakobranchus ocellatus TaxID=259542 RepID=A0AAV4ABA2_9GAST|nr:fatty acid synthase [Plakobranchus ocellatus]
MFSPGVRRRGLDLLPLLKWRRLKSRNSSMAPQEQPSSKERGEEIVPVNVRTVRPYEGEIVVSGISGRYPDSANVGELQYNLLNGINMITVDNRRWEPGDLIYY